MSRPKTERESVKVAVRVRPLNGRETKSSDGTEVIVSMQSARAFVALKTPSAALKASEDGLTKPPPTNDFQFDSVFWSVDCPDESGQPPASQADVFTRIGLPLVQHAFTGFNSCLFAYGQTGSGKTYTMMGGDVKALGGEDAGVTPRICLEIFDRKTTLEADGVVKWTVELGYVEVYNERVSDLLAKKKKGGKPGEEVFVEVREHPSRGVFIEGQRFVEVKDLADVVKYVEVGNAVRHTAATKMNDRSSRSHAIVMLVLREERTMTTKGGDVITTAGKNSRMNLVDLAGSERVAQSQVEGQQFKEATHINLSLTTLGRVIDILADMAKKGKSSQYSVAPFRDSKLTYILKDSLGGNSKTFMIATVSPSAMNYDETLSTLRYASRARDIVTVAQVNEDPRARRIRELEEQMSTMREDLKGADPAYVNELEEKLRLLESEAQKRAADLQALEKEREQNALRERMLKATETEKQELSAKATALQNQVAESRRQAADMLEQNLKLREEQEHKQREMAEEMERRRAAFSTIRRSKEAEIESGRQQLDKMVQQLDEERESRNRAMESLKLNEDKLNHALLDTRRTEQERAALAAEREQMMSAMRSLEKEAQEKQKLQRELLHVQGECDRVETENVSLRVALEEMEARYTQTTFFMLSVMDLLETRHEEAAQLTLDAKDASLSALSSELQERIDALTAEKAAAERDLTSSKDELSERLATAEADAAALQSQLDALTAEKAAAERDLTSSKDELSERLATSEAAAAALQSQLDALTAEKAAAERDLTSSKDELSERLATAEAAAAALQSQLDALTAEKAAAERDLTSSKDELSERLATAEAAAAALQSQLDALTAEKAAAERDLTSSKDELSERLATAEADAAALQSQLDALTAEKAAAERDLTSSKDELSERLATSEAAAAALQSQLDALTAEKAAAERDLTSSKDELTERLATAEAAAAALQSQLDALTAEKAAAERDLTSSKDELSERLATSEAAAAALQSQLDALTAEKAAAERDLTSSKDELSERLATSEAAAAAAVASHETQTATLNAMVEKLKRDKSAYATRLSQVEQELLIRSAQLDATREALSEELKKNASYD